MLHVKKDLRTLFFFILGLLVMTVFAFLFFVKEVQVSTEEALACQGCNVIIISLTNTRKDHIGLYGYERDTTPNIDMFFKNSLVFTNAFAPASWTLPNGISLFTSLFPHTHHVMQRYQGDKINSNISTLAEVLKDNGYTTAAFTGDGDYNRRFNIHRGFDVYLDKSTYADFEIEYHVKFQRPAGQSGGYYMPISSSLPPALAWLKKNKDKKFFMFVQGFDTHCPFIPEPPFDSVFGDDYESTVDFSHCLWTFEQALPQTENGIQYWEVESTAYLNDDYKKVRLEEGDIKKMISLYDGEIAQADADLENFFNEFEALELGEKTIVVFMSEHGDLFGEHGRFMRGGPLRGTFYDQVLNIPLLMKHPRISTQVVIDDLVQIVDIMPTLLSILGATDDQAALREGKSLSFSVWGDKEVNEYVYAGSQYQGSFPLFTGSSVIESIRGKKWKFIREKIYTEDEGVKVYRALYDIENDPEESSNLYETEKEVAALLTSLLDDWSKSPSPEDL